MENQSQLQVFVERLKSQGFVLEKKQKGFNIGGSDEAVFTKFPEYEYRFYVGQLHARGPIVFHTGARNGKKLDIRKRHDYERKSSSNNHVSYVWEAASFLELIGKL